MYFVCTICRKIFSVHPKFRMIGIGETVKSSGSSQPSGHGSSGHAPSLAPWISPEVMSMFQFHHVKALPVDQEKLVIQHKVHISRALLSSTYFCIGLLILRFPSFLGKTVTQCCNLFIL